MKIAVIVVLVLIAVGLFRLLRPAPKGAARSSDAARKLAAGREARNAAPANDSAHHAVSVKRGRDACEQVLALGDRRFLPAQLGSLPLAGCTSTNCQCKFEHHPDRRDSDGDNRAPTALRSELYAASGKPERRTRRGRRKGDFK